MLTLYFAPGSSSMAPHIALHEIGAPFVAKPLSFAQKENRQAGYLALNPEGKVPTLVIGERPLTEVAAILFYLAKRFPAAGLLPAADCEAEAQAISWMSFLAATVHPARRQGAEFARSVWALAERRLGDKRWALGDYSIVDIHLFRLYWRQRNLLKDWIGAFPALEAHYQGMLARPAVLKTCAIEARIGFELPA
jgi:glutathione S-transferase